MLSSIWRPAKAGKPAVELKDHSPEGVSLHLEDWCPPFGLPPLLPERPRSSNAWRRDPSLSGGSSRNVPDVDAELNPIDTTQWYPMLMRKDYKVAVLHWAIGQPPNLSVDFSVFFRSDAG